MECPNLGLALRRIVRGRSRSRRSSKAVAGRLGQRQPKAGAIFVRMASMTWAL
jgi:hypothetical protein